MGITIVWVEHIMGVLMRVVDRVIVLDHGEKIFEGAPAQAAVDPRVTEVYLGKSAGLSRMLSLAAVSAGYGSFQRPVRRLARGAAGRGGRRHRAERRRQDHADARHFRAAADARRRDDARGPPVGGLPAHHMVEQGIAHVPENRRLFPRLSVEDNLRIGAFIPQARRHFAEQLELGLRPVSPPEGSPRAAGRHAVRRRAADVRHRPRADVEAEAAADGRALGRAWRRWSCSRCSSSCAASAPKG